MNATRYLALGLVAGVALGFGAGFLVGSGPAPKPSHALTGTPAIAQAADTGRGERSGPSALLPIAQEDAPADRSDAVPAAKANIVDREVDSLVRAAEAALTEPRAKEGTGTLSGTVWTVDGAPVAGVLMRAKPTNPRARPAAADALGQAPEPLDDIHGSLTEYARVAARVQQGTREVTTGPDGTYLLEGLPETTYNLAALRAGYSIKGVRSAPSLSVGSELDFLAQRVSHLELRVLDPTGAEVEEVTLEIDSDSTRGTRSVVWSHGQAVHLEPGLHEIAANMDPVEDSGSSSPVFRLRSPAQKVVVQEDAQPEPVLLELAQRTGIHGKVIVGPTEGTGLSSMNVLLAHSPAGTEVDLSLLDRSNAARSTRPRSGEYSILDLDPGRYAIGISRGWGLPVSDLRTFELAEELLELDLELSPIDPSDYLTIRAFGPAGLPLKGLGFRLVESHEGGSSSSSLRGVALPDGATLLTLPASAKATLASPSGAGEVGLTVSHSDYGERKVVLTPGQEVLEVQFEVPATLEVTVAGYSGSEYVGRLTVRASSTSNHNVFRSGSGAGTLDEHGRQTLEALSPGPCTAVLQLISRDPGRRWMPTTLAEVAIDLKGGHNTVQLTLPTLYSLSVHAPDMDPGTPLHVTSRTDPEAADAGSWRTFLQGKLGEDRRCLFEDLPEGTYSVTGGRGSTTVEVPGEEAVLEPRR